jgi:lysophospholipase L1-like esterase
MLDVAIDGGPVAIVGALDFDRSPAGITPRRLPAWTRAQLPDPFVDVIVQMPSGVRLRFATDGTAIELDVMLRLFRLLPNPPIPAVFDLVVDGELGGRVRSDVGTVVTVDLADRSQFAVDEGEPTTVRFDGLAATPKVIEIWLPHASVVELRGLRVEGGAVAAAAPAARRQWIHYGSSISHCMEAASPTTTWPAVAAHAAGVELLSLGLAGQCMLDPFVARTIRDHPADVISVKVGINLVNGDAMRDRTFAPALHGFLDTVREGQPSRPVLLVSPIYCPPAEEKPGPTIMGPHRRFITVDGLPELRLTCLTLTKVRAAIESVVGIRRKLGDEHLHYLNGLELFGPDDGRDLPDDLHPNAAGYVRIGERFAALAFGPGGALA